MRDANTIMVPVKEVAVSNIKQLYTAVNGDEGKFDALCAIYESVNVGQTIIFVNRKETARTVGDGQGESGFGGRF